MFSDNGLVWAAQEQKAGGNHRGDDSLGEVSSVLSPDLCAALDSMSELLALSSHGNPFIATPPAKQHPFDEANYMNKFIDTHTPTTATATPNSPTDPINLSFFMPLDLLFVPDTQSSRPSSFSPGGAPSKSDILTRLNLPTPSPRGEISAGETSDADSSINSTEEEVSPNDKPEKPHKATGEAGDGKSQGPTGETQTICHSVSPARLACRKRLTLTANRRSSSIRRLVCHLRCAVNRNDWPTALRVTVQFCYCAEGSEFELLDCRTDTSGGGGLQGDVSELPSTSADSEASVSESSAARSIAVTWDSLRLQASQLMCYEDFAMLCASLFTPLKHIEPGQPPMIYPRQSHLGHPEQPLTEGAREIRQLICDIQTLLLMCMATKLDMQPSEQLRMKNLATSALYTLVWHPHILEALAPIFFNVCGHYTNDCFCTFLIHWGGTGVLQLIFEVFVLVLARRARWRAALWLLSCTALGEGLLLPSICLTHALETEPFLPEVANITSCRSEILTRLRFPVRAVTDILLDLCSYQLPAKFHDQPWPFKVEARDLVLSILPLVMCKPFSDEIMVHRGWHDRVRGKCPVDRFGPGNMLAFLMHQISNSEGERLLLGEDDLMMDSVLDEVVPAFVFMGDPTLRDEYVRMLPNSGGRLPENWVVDHREENDLSTWLPSHPTVLASSDLLELPASVPTLSEEEREKIRVQSYLHKEEFMDLWYRLHDHPEALDRCLCIVELAGRIAETYFVQNKQSPYAEVIEGNTRESLLQMSKRTVGELTGCTLGRVDLCYLRLLESYETIYGVPSQLSGLVGPRKGFQPCLNMSLLVHKFTLAPLMKGLPRSPVKRVPVTADETSDPSDSFVFPTLLPVHVARTLPAWLSARAHGSPYEGLKPWSLCGWRVLAREIIVAASRSLQRFPKEPRVAPHIDCELLNMFLPLYVEAANPRALHLLTRLAIASRVARFKDDMPGYLIRILERALNSKFVLIADAVSQICLFDASDLKNAVLARMVMEVYIAAGDGVRAVRHLESVTDPQCVAALQPFAAAAKELLASKHQKTKEGSSAKNGSAQSTKEEKLRRSLAVVKELASNNDVRGAVEYFHELRGSPGGILDISVANKILHLCVTNSCLPEAEEILRVMRADAHSEINGMDFIPGACVRPDVVTCNIVIKGLARHKPPRLSDIDRMIQQMEEPFHLGGDGVKADQVTFNTAIHAATASNDLEKAWEYFLMMRKRNVKVDGFTCSILLRQLGPNTRAEIIEEITAIVEELHLYEDSVLLASMVDIYNQLRETSRLKKLLDKYQSRVPNPTPYSIATLMRGYGRCGRMSKVTALWRRLECRTDVRWTPYIFGCAVEAFTACGHLTQALTVAEMAKSMNTVLPDQQLSALIRLCVPHQRFGEAIKLYRYMREHNMNPCDVTYNNLMHTCVQAGDLETAIEILHDMTQNATHPPDVVTYSTIIKGLCDRGEMASAMQLFNSLPAQGLKPDIVTYNTILEGWAKAGDLEQVETIFKELVATRVKPTCFTLTILVKFYGRRRLADHVVELVQTLPKVYKFKMDTFAYTATIAACSWNGKLEEAIFYLQEMRQTFGAGARTYGTMIAGSVKHRDWQSLSVVLRLAYEDKAELEKRDVCVLRDIYRQWCQGSISDRWIYSGFDARAAEQIRVFLATQRKQGQPISTK